MKEAKAFADFLQGFRRKQQHGVSPEREVWKTAEVSRLALPFLSGVKAADSETL